MTLSFAIGTVLVLAAVLAAHPPAAEIRIEERDGVVYLKSFELPPGTPTGFLTGAGVTATGLGLSGTAAGNHQLSSTNTTTTADITARAITVTANAEIKVYGAPDPALTYQATSGALANGNSFSGVLTRVAGEIIAGSPWQ